MSFIINENLKWAHPIVQEWFIGKFTTPTEPQVEGWPSILAGKTTLISAPTGSGKTLAAFLACIDQLVRQAIAGNLPNETEVLYVSPLKALSNDVEKNLQGPIAEIQAIAKQHGIEMQEIRISVRTGDTPTNERQKMLKKPPHILVTTPESLYILLTAGKSRELLKTIKTVIVDEIHAVANSKRGSHLALSLERLYAITNHFPVRIGLSATQKPMETVAAFLNGNRNHQPVIVNIGHAKQLELKIEVPNSELGAVASNEMWDEIYNKVAELAQQNRSTLVFVNTRRLAERVAHHLTERLGQDLVAAHHGSLSRKLRLQAETKLKNGELKVLVATASLELGIDIGNIDLVCQLGSPRSIATALQRIGRAGHWHGAISKGYLFATTRDELLECAALVHAIQENDLDKLIIPHEPLDILAQQIIALCVTDEWDEKTLFNVVKKAYPYKNLSRETYNEILTMLSEGIAGSRGRYGAYLFRDRVNNIVKARRHSKIVAITSGGAIPENGLYKVVQEPQDIVVGTLDEDFAVESNRGDIILLGTTSWQIKRVESATGRVLVEDAHGSPPTVPFWRGEAPARTDELSLQVANLREKINELMPKHATPAQKDETINWLKTNTRVNELGAKQLIEYLEQGRALLGAIPTQKTIIAERFFDEGGGMQLVIHAPFGARINKAWGLALRKKFCRSFNFELQAAATDDGLNISLTEQHSFPLADVFHFLHPNTIKDVLIQAVLQSPLFATRWRWDATRALALVRFRHGKKVPPNIQRILADDLLAAVFPDAAACQDNLAGKDIALPDHPLINETMKDALNEALDIDGLSKVLKDIQSDNIQCLAIDTPMPSVFSHEILNANPYAYLDDAPLEERRARAVEMRRVLPAQVLEEIGRLDPTAIDEVKKQAWPDIRDADELHDTLQTLITLPEEHANQWQEYFNQLQNNGRVTKPIVKQKTFWVAAEKIKTFSLIYPDAILQASLKEIDNNVLDRETAIHEMIKGWMLHSGPITTTELNKILQIDTQDIDKALIRLETTGYLLRGHFRNQSNDEIEWCERRLLARIHRLTIGTLRKEIKPVTIAQFMQWLLQWQHVTAETKLNGEHGLLAVIRQLQGFEMPANAWERDIFAKRIKDYDSDWLDQLCLSGVIGWGRLSPHPAMINNEEAEDKFKKRIIPTSVAPITFFVREESQWMPGHAEDSEADLTHLSPTAKSIYQFLQKRGASFFIDIVNGVQHLKSEVEIGLWELVAAGKITADGFDNLRALIDPKRRLVKKRRRRMLPRMSAGRWSLLYTSEVTDANQHIEAICWMLLNRYGVIFRDLIQREKLIPRWRDILVALRRLEDRGEIRGGRFVDGFLGEQFALPYAVESLRAIKKQIPQNESITLAAVDPLNLIGIILPGKRVAAFSGNLVTIVDQR